MLHRRSRSKWTLAQRGNVPIYHSHRVPPGVDSFSIGREDLVSGLAECPGNIWMAKWKGGW